MPEATLAMQPHLAHDLLSPENLALADETVFELFAQMLGLAVAVTAPPTLHTGGGDERTAIVGYSGALRGCCEVRSNEGAARIIASAMLGGLPIEDEDSLDDAIGEVCNMIAGGWKDRIPTLSSHCSLSPPTVITGRAYKVQMSRPSVKISRCYHFEGQYLFLTLRREDLPVSARRP